MWEWMCPAKVYEVGEVQGRVYIAMQYVDGQPLNALVDGLTVEVHELVADAQRDAARVVPLLERERDRRQVERRYLARMNRIGLGFFAPRLIFSGNAAMAHAAYWGYAVLWGLLTWAAGTLCGGGAVARAAPFVLV